jgi:hypothetical protein
VIRIELSSSKGDILNVDSCRGLPGGGSPNLALQRTRPAALLPVEHRGFSRRVCPLSLVVMLLSYCPVGEQLQRRVIMPLEEFNSLFQGEEEPAAVLQKTLESRQVVSSEACLGLRAGTKGKVEEGQDDGDLRAVPTAVEGPQRESPGTSSCPYSPKCVEGVFSEVRRDGVLYRRSLLRLGQRPSGLRAR